MYHHNCLALARTLMTEMRSPRRLIPKTGVARRRVGHRRRACVALVAVAVAVAALGVTAPAKADPFGLDTPIHSVEGVGAIPDNFNHTYCFDGAGWTQDWRRVVHARMANLDDQTNYFDTWPIDHQCFPTTDLWFRLDSTMADRGDYRCRVWAYGSDGPTDDDRCEGATIRLNSRAGVLPDTHQRRKTACHEIGHSVGIAHHDPLDTSLPGYVPGDCMVSGRAPAGAQYEQYNQHHIEHANSRTPSQS
jgi:hypothetical protein